SRQNSQRQGCCFQEDEDQMRYGRRHLPGRGRRKTLGDVAFERRTYRYVAGYAASAYRGVRKSNRRYCEKTSKRLTKLKIIRRTNNGRYSKNRRRSKDFDSCGA